MFCPNCGAQLPNTATMCYSCRFQFINPYNNLKNNQTTNPRTNPDPRINQPVQFDIPQYQNRKAMNAGFVNNNNRHNNQSQNGKQLKVEGIIGIVFLCVVGLYILSCIISGLNKHNSEETLANKTNSTTEIEMIVESEENSTEELVTEAREEINQYTETIPLDVVYEDDNLLIKTTSYNHDSTGIDIGLYIENKTDRNITYDNTYTGVNNYTFIAVVYGDITAGNKTNEKLHISADDLSLLGNQSIKRFNLKFSVWDSDDWSDLITDVITIKTSEYDDKDEAISGVSLYTDDNIEVLYNSKSGNKYSFILINNSEEMASFSVEGITVNGFTNSDIFIMGEFVYGKSAAIFDIELSKDFLQLNSIEKIENIEFSVEYYPSQDYQRRMSTGVIKIDSFNE